MTLYTDGSCQEGGYAHDVASPNFDEIETRLQALEAAAPVVSGTGFSDIRDYAVGDYNPVDGSGTNDTAAVQAWINASRALIVTPGKRLAGGRRGWYKITNTITIPSCTTIVGTDRVDAAFWSEVPMNKTAFELAKDTPYGNYLCNFQNFGIYGGANAGQWLFSSPRVGLVDCWFWWGVAMDLTVNGGWDRLIHIWRTAAGTGPAAYGGLENCRIKLRQHAVPYTTVPRGGVYNQGWVNSCEFDFDFDGLGAAGSYGFYMSASYLGASGSRFSGSIKNSLGRAVWIDGSILSTGIRPHLVDLWCENNAEGDITVVSHGLVNIHNVHGDVTLNNCWANEVRGLNGTLTQTGLDVQPVIAGSIQDETAGVALLPSDVAQQTAFITSGNAPSGRGGSPVGDPVNLLMNGDFTRWMDPTRTARNVWGAVIPGNYYIATKCGEGLVDTTRTRGAKYCMLWEMWPTWGYSFGLEFAKAGQLANHLYQPITLSFKWKQKDVGVNALYGSLVASNALGAGAGAGAMSTLSCENGFYRSIYSGLISQNIIDHGGSAQLATSTGVSTFYVSEMMVTWGQVPPRDYVQCRENFDGDVRIENGLLRYQGAAAPAGGDPINNQANQVGDEIEIPPIAGGYRKLVCTVAGSPGTWKGFDAISA